MPQWQVELYVYGPVTVKGNVPLREPKGWDADDLFYSDILVRSIRSGAVIDLTARADSERLARRAALYYVGEALDVLALDIRLPLYLSLLDRQPIRPEMLRFVASWTNRSGIRLLTLPATSIRDQQHFCGH